MAKILIVEDNQGTNKAICEYMKEAGHTLFSAFTGSEALKIFREKELDIIVLDIMLPEMSGIVVFHAHFRETDYCVTSQKPEQACC